MNIQRFVLVTEKSILLNFLFGLIDLIKISRIHRFMSKEDIPTNHENAEKTAEEIKNADRLNVLNEWLNWIEERNGGKPAALILREKMNKSSGNEKENK